MTWSRILMTKANLVLMFDAVLYRCLTILLIMIEKASLMAGEL